MVGAHSTALKVCFARRSGTFVSTLIVRGRGRDVLNAIARTRYIDALHVMGPSLCLGRGGLGFWNQIVRHSTFSLPDDTLLGRYGLSAV
jgi:hypothetical protein